MASPGAVSAEPPGEEDIDGEIPREQARIGISTGTDLLVSFNGTSTELKIQFDKQGKIRIFGDEIGPQLPKTFERPRGFDLILVPRRPVRKFDFFRLSGEIRNRIYNHLYPEPILSCSVDFRKTLPLNWRDMMDHMAVYAVGGDRFHRLNEDLRRETLSYILRSIRFHARGDKQAFAFLESLGPVGRAQWRGAFGIELTSWLKDATAEGAWMSRLTECKRLREIVLIRTHPYAIDYSSDFFASRGDGFRRILRYFRAKFPRLERLKIGTSVSPLLEKELLCFLKGEEYGGPWYKNRDDGATMTELLLTRFALCSKKQHG
ncbi:hypothetical protein IWZ00DRAFT_549042 [Phyllosticta capitalensis]|uniref:Uncharacterized protein n=1 Tax=Phyllosticta capitalensis TaxID=121624 RepID=A0ABR1YDL0_9PEZI